VSLHLAVVVDGLGHFPLAAWEEIVLSSLLLRLTVLHCLFGSDCLPCFFSVLV